MTPSSFFPLLPFFFFTTTFRQTPPPLGRRAPAFCSGICLNAVPFLLIGSCALTGHGSQRADFTEYGWEYANNVSWNLFNVYTSSPALTCRRRRLIGRRSRRPSVAAILGGNSFRHLGWELTSPRVRLFLWRKDACVRNKPLFLFTGHLPVKKALLSFGVSVFVTFQEL